MTKEIERRRVLVIDDNEDIHGDFRKTLERHSPTQRLAAATAVLFGESHPTVHHAQNFEVESAHQGQEGCQKVEQARREGRPYALAFVDMRMPPGWDGVETIQHLWQVDPELQVVICTAFSDYSWEQIINTLGTTDRLLILKKPFDPMEVCQLAAALSEKWKLKRQATLKLGDLEKMVHDRTSELRQLALMDKLTGLPNRNFFQDLLRKAIARAEAEPTFQFAIHFFDLDRFKVINDSLGHMVGDKLLIAFAERIRSLLGQKAGDDCEHQNLVAARLGGDEFVILQRGIASAKDASDLAEKALETMKVPFDIDGIEIHASASIGIATSESDLRWSEDILRDADNAMYRAKAQGKGCCVLFNQEMHRQAIERFTLENDLRRAIQQQELFLQYQPIVTLKDGKLIGFEALLRWQHPKRGLISPNEFIPIAEETGLIVSIGKWVVDEATRQLQQWTNASPLAASLSISVNCSRKQLTDAHFPDALGTILAHNRLDPRRLNLEITESTIMDDGHVTREVLTRIKAMGIRLHMDDFGTGYSSLNCLHGMPLDVLKIDRSFINNVSKKEDYEAIIDAIVALAHNLNMQVVAEGVESVDHTTMLCALKCDHAQGYFFSKPLSADDARNFITVRHTSPVTANTQARGKSPQWAGRWPLH